MDFYMRINNLHDYEKRKNNKWKNQINPILLKCLDEVIKNNLGKYIVIFTNNDDYYFKIKFFKPIDIKFINSLFISDKRQIIISTTELVIFHKSDHFSLTPYDENLAIRETFFYPPDETKIFLYLLDNLHNKKSKNYYKN